MFSPTAHSPRRIFKRYNCSCSQTGDVNCFLAVWRSMPLFHWNHRHPLPFPTLSSETNIEKQYANLGWIRNAGRVCQKGMHCGAVRSRGKENPGPYPHMDLLWKPTTGTLEQPWREPGFSGCSWVSNQEKWKETLNNCRFIVGFPNKDFL